MEWKAGTTAPPEPPERSAEGAEPPVLPPEPPARSGLRDGLLALPTEPPARCAARDGLLALPPEPPARGAPGDEPPVLPPEPPARCGRRDELIALPPELPTRCDPRDGLLALPTEPPARCASGAEPPVLPPEPPARCGRREELIALPPELPTRCDPREGLFALPVEDFWVVVEPLRGISARVNAAAVRKLAAGDGSVPQLEALAGPPPCVEPPSRRGPLSPQFLGLITTRACNTDCAYCGFGAGAASGGSLDPRVAVAAIDWMAGLAAREGRETLDIHLFGGEPFLAGDVVDVIVHRTRIAAAARGLKPVLEAATNGVCPASRARFAGDYFASIALSLDGPAEIHDCHRPLRGGLASFPSVERTARILADAAADLTLRACVSRKSVAGLPSIAAWMAETFRPAAIDFETLEPTPRSAEAGLFPPDPYRFAEAFELARRAASPWGVPVLYSASVREKPRACFCPLGNDAVIVETGGSLHACYMEAREWEARGLDLRIGTATAGEGLCIDDASVARVRGAAVRQAKCAACFCRSWCAGGCRVRASGQPESGYGDFCIQTRLITIASLLDRLQGSASAAALLADRQAAEKLALRPSDRIADWRCQL